MDEPTITDEQMAEAKKCWDEATALARLFATNYCDQHPTRGNTAVFASACVIAARRAIFATAASGNPGLAHALAEWLQDSIRVDFRGLKAGTN